MKGLPHQLDTLRRRTGAAALAAARDGNGERPIATPTALRFGVAKITSATGGGAYTITEQWYDPSGSGQWTNATDPLGYVLAAGRDYRDRDTGAANDVVRFWEQRAIGGGLELLIDVADTDEQEQENVVEHAGVALAVAGWLDIDEEGTGTITLSEADWRGRLIRYNAAWEDEPIGRPLANTEDGTFVLDILAGAATTVISKSINGDLADLYVDGTDSGKLKIDLTDNGNYGHFAFLVQATDFIEPAGG